MIKSGQIPFENLIVTIIRPKFQSPVFNALEDKCVDLTLYIVHKTRIRFISCFTCHANAVNFFCENRVSEVGHEVSSCSLRPEWLFEWLNIDSEHTD